MCDTGYQGIDCSTFLFESDDVYKKTIPFPSGTTAFDASGFFSRDIAPRDLHVYKMEIPEKDFIPGGHSIHILMDQVSGSPGDLMLLVSVNEVPSYSRHQNFDDTAWTQKETRQSILIDSWNEGMQPGVLYIVVRSLPDAKIDSQYRLRIDASEQGALFPRTTYVQGMAHAFILQQHVQCAIATTVSRAISAKRAYSRRILVME